MEGVPFHWSDYLSSEGLSATGFDTHGGQAGQVGFKQCGSSREAFPVSDLDSPWNHSVSRMIQAGDTAECPSTPMHAWHNPQLASQHETYGADESQGYDITGSVHSDCAQNLAQVAPNNEPFPSEEQHPHHGSTSILDPYASINPVPPQQVLGPNELKVLLPEQACHCATCLVGYRWPSRPELRRDEWTAQIFSCRVTGCQWTTEGWSHAHWPRDNFEKLLDHEGWNGREGHYGKLDSWRCCEVGCKFVTKRWEDFLRHSTSKHCIEPKDLKCPFLECKYHHIDFSRKDKLKSHVDKVHKGSPHPGSPNQAIKPKVKDHA